MSRRALLKRAGVAAGAAWTVPLIQSAVAPAAAASGVSLLPNGAPCSGDGVCASGWCLRGICGVPGKSWTGSVCATANDCWSGICLGGKCKPGPLGATCATVADCQNNVNCAAGSHTCGGAGASCQNKNKCAAGYSCVKGVCV